MKIKIFRGWGRGEDEGEVRYSGGENEGEGRYSGGEGGSSVGTELALNT